MKRTHQLLLLRQTDELFLPWKPLLNHSPPRRGWINAIRKALGMSARQLAARIGVTRQAIHDLEGRERKRGVTLAALERAAAAMDCELLYAIVPKESLKETVRQRARALAARRLGAVAHSLRLEEQGVPSAELDSQIDDIAAQILQGSRRDLWSE